MRQVLLEATADLQTPISPYWLRHAHDRGATLPQGQSDAGARQHHARPESSNGLKLDPGCFFDEYQSDVGNWHTLSTMGPER